MKKILLLAQTPPPHHGQAIMQQYLVQQKWHWCDKEHIRLEYSNNIQDVGHFSFSKITKLFRVLNKIVSSYKRGKIDVLYYPPSGPNRIPLYRDIITLLFAKFFAKKIVLHFHAGGLSELIDRLNFLEKYFAKLAFKKVDDAIVLLPWLKHEVIWFSPKNTHIVPNGIQDVVTDDALNKKLPNGITNILFVGNLKDEKGIFVLLSAVKKIKSDSHPFCLRIMGEPHSQEVKSEILNFIKTNTIEDKVVLLGSCTGEKKWEEFKNAHIFCLPTYATEAMPVSIIEAMMFSLPIVSTKWRGISNMINDNIDGLLVKIKDDRQLANALSTLINDPSKAIEMGKNGRKKFEDLYTIDKHLTQMEKIFKSV